MHIHSCLTLLCDVSGHHPDLHLEGWNGVRIAVWTHSIGERRTPEVNMVCCVWGTQRRAMLSEY